MPQIHYLNVKNGDCSWIKHYDGKISVIDVNNAFSKSKTDKVNDLAKSEGAKYISEILSKGNFNQKNYPVNPIEYLKKHSVTSVFRFILTHPDMDHMDGIEDFFDEFSPVNFWDTENTKELADFSSGRYQESDWDFYIKHRDGVVQNPKRLTLYSGAKGKYFNEDENGNGGGNGITILAPTKELMRNANLTEDWNDASYVILYQTEGKKIIFGGDASDDTWNYLMENHKENISDIDLLIAPHHGRKSSCSYDFLKIMKPKVTFFGNADKATHLAHDMFNNLGLYKITNNQGNCLIAELSNSTLNIFVTNKRFAEAENPSTFYDSDVQGYYIKSI
jgi:competence protein ComEC